MSMTRGELARRTGCNLETVRYYEKIGLMPDPGRTESGYRQYDERHEDRLRFIIRGRELGFSIDGIKGLLDLVDRRAVSCADVKVIARLHLEEIRGKLADLRRMERVLTETTRCCSGTEVPECPLFDTLFHGWRPDQGRRQ
jgi:MerR family mercuric resistance operon transcriptional regulator